MNKMKLSQLSGSKQKVTHGINNFILNDMIRLMDLLATLTLRGHRIQEQNFILRY